MIYLPKETDIQTLLKRLKFRCIGSNEYVRSEWSKNRKSSPIAETLIRRRYHVFIKNGVIDCHYDMPKRGKKHVAQNYPSGKGGSRIRSIQKEFEMMDYRLPSN